MIKRIFYPFVAKENINVQKNVDNMTDEIITKSVSVRQTFSHFIYHVEEKPQINNDKKTHQQLSLYLSDDLGKDLIKLHPDNQFVTKHDWLPELARYYFVTQTDSNQNGYLDEQDNSFYYFIDFNHSKPKATNYNFIR